MSFSRKSVFQPAFSLLLETSLGSVLLEKRRHITTDEREIRRRVLGPNAAGIVVEHDIQHPVHGLHAPVTPDTDCELSYPGRSTEQEITNLDMALSISLRLRDGLADARRTCPEICHGFHLRWYRANSVESFFLSATLFPTVFFDFTPLAFSPSS